MSSEVKQNSEIQIKELSDKNRNLKEEISFLLYKFETCYVDTKDDMRIINFLGATEIVFAECEDRFNKGENLIKMINLITKSNIANVEGLENNSDNIPAMDQVVANFIDNDRNEVHLKVMGEKSDGEYFLLSWQIKKFEKFIRHYFKVTPTNQMVKLAQEKNIRDLNNFKLLIKNILSLVQVGIVILDVSQRIQFINEISKSHSISNNNDFLKNAVFDNKHFKDVIFMCDQDDMTFRLETNKNVLESKKQIKYERMINNGKIIFEVNPIFDNSNSISGLAILSFKESKDVQTDKQTSNLDVRKLLLTVKHFNSKNKELFERVNELETNHKWFIQNSQSYEATIKTLYSHIDNIPYPISFIDMPTQKITLINSAFQKAIEIDKKLILGKSDFEIFSKEHSDILLLKNDECIKDKSIIDFNLNDNINIKQSAFMDFGKNKMVIVRVYYLKNNKFNLKIDEKEKEISA